MFSFQYSVVVFYPENSDEDESVEVVATKWLSEDRKKCLWPTKKKTEQDKARRLAMTLSDANRNWSEFDVKYEKSYRKSFSVILPIFSSRRFLITF